MKRYEMTKGMKRLCKATVSQLKIGKETHSVE